MPDSISLPVSAEAIAAAILSAPAVTRLGLACPYDRLRERAAGDLAQDIVEKLKAERDQLRLAL